MHVESERSQARNKARALELLRSKLYARRLGELQEAEDGMKISGETPAEWGRQIRSYVLHPYKMVKDHRTGAETSDAEAVLGGALDEFIEAEKHI